MIRITRIIRLILLFLVVISTGGVYYQFFSTAINFTSLGLAFLLLLVTKIRINEFSLKAVVSLAILFLLMLVNFIVNLKSSLKVSDFLSLSVRILIVFILVYHYKVRKESFIRELNIILIILIIHGILNFLLINIFRDHLLAWSNTNGQYNVRTLGYIFFVFDYYPLLRNCGLFWEPGVYQYFINLYIFIRLFILRSGNLAFITFGFLMVLSTQSTLGIIVFGLLVSIYYFQNITLRRLSAFGLVLALSFVLFWPNIKEKFSGNYKLSYQARVFDSVTGLYAILDRPLFGYGYYPGDNSRLTYTTSYYQKGLAAADLDYIYKRGNTNSVMINFVYWGIPIGAIILFLLYRQTVFERKKLLFFIFNILVSLAEPLLFSGLFLLYLSSSLLSNMINPSYLPDEKS